MDILLPEFKQLLHLLNKHKVSYMLIGGYAVIYYGYERNTTDMDIWLKGDNQNRDKLISALREFGIQQDDLSTLAGQDFTKIQMFFFGKKPRRVDFLNTISGIGFDEAEKDVNHFPMQNEMIPIIQYHHLILSKISTGRPKDAADIDCLQKINRDKNKK